LDSGFRIRASGFGNAAARQGQNSHKPQAARQGRGTAVKEVKEVKEVKK